MSFCKYRKAGGLLCKNTMIKSNLDKAQGLKYKTEGLIMSLIKIQVL
jgi:hypothetical protein